MTGYDPFEALNGPWSAVTIHNVLLLDVQPGEGGCVRLTVEREGQSREVVGGARWSEEWSRRDVGRHGFLEPVHPVSLADIPPAGACYFRAYVDPSLRRVPELDNKDGERGWRCDAQPHGFVAPANVIPGEASGFVPDQTVVVSVRVPPEFVRVCRGVQRAPEQVLEGFVGDAAGLQNAVACPRADGFGSNGSSEREMADAWLQRAYGMDSVDVDLLEVQDDEAEQRRLDLDDVDDLMKAYEACGGTAEELIAAVRGLVEEQRRKAESAEG